GETIHVLAMRRDLADRSWFTDQGLFVGPDYVTENLSLRFPTSGGHAKAYDAQGAKDIVGESPGDPPAPAALTNWKSRDGAAERLDNFDDSAWASSPDPAPLASLDDFANGYGWYRTTYDAPKAGASTLFFPGGADTLQAFVNGAAVDIGKGQLTVQANQGKNT